MGSSESCCVTSKGGAGVAGSAIVVLVSTLAATGTVPVAAVGLILGVHRLLSSAFVAVNILGNALATIVIAQWEGAVDQRSFWRAGWPSRRRPTGRQVRGLDESGGPFYTLILYPALPHFVFRGPLLPGMPRPAARDLL